MPDPLDILLEQGELAAEDLARARHLAGRERRALPSTLVRLGMVSEQALAEAMAQSHQTSTVSRGELPSHLPAIPGLNRQYIAQRHILPMRFEGETLLLAMADPGERDAMEALRFAADVEAVTPLVATYSDIEEALALAWPIADSPGEEEPAAGPAGDDLERLAESDSEAPVIRLVQRLLAGAAARRASDVHIEPMARHVSVRYRIDGHLVEVERLSDALAAPIASRIKVMAGLDIAESRLPQDGRLRFTMRGRDVDVRVSTSPVAYGESIVMRLLGRSSLPLELDALRLPAGPRAALEQALDRPHGIILLTGPTGSGKTTTLYAAINRLRRPNVKILTVEDPVEILLEGVNQVQVRPDIDLTYANALRAFLRQDPDILMIGEIRDRETADIAMRAALTGHLVLSTLHTQSAIGAFTRLEDLGIEPFLTASTVIATVAQRLVRRLCDSCKAPEAVTQETRSAFEQAGLDAPAQVMKATGCASCSGSGYHGRLPIMEIFTVDEGAREAIREQRTPTLESSRATTDTLLAHGLMLVAACETDMVEVQRAVSMT